MQYRTIHPRSRGFTLVELIASIVVSVIVCGSAGSLLWNAAQQQSEVSARGELTEIASIAQEVMVRYLREIPQNECPGNPTPCLASHAQITTATSSRILWGVYGFRKSGTELQITTNSSANWWTLATDVSALQFAYYNRLGQDMAMLSSPDSDPMNIRTIQITLTLTRANQSTTLRTGLYLRNFMNEVTSDP